MLNIYSNCESIFGVPGRRLSLCLSVCLSVSVCANSEINWTYFDVIFSVFSLLKIYLLSLLSLSQRSKIFVRDGSCSIALSKIEIHMSTYMYIHD